LIWYTPGLGLFIASEIARAHGGMLRATSNDCETRFIFQMPLRPAAAWPG
jgi:signal transduction histidine kinase